MQRGQKQKSPGNRVLTHYKRSSSSPVFLMQAASVCVSSAAHNPLGGQWRLEVGVWGEPFSPFHAVFFSFSLLSVSGRNSAVPSQFFKLTKITKNTLNTGSVAVMLHQVILTFLYLIRFVDALSAHLFIFQLFLQPPNLWRWGPSFKLCGVSLWVHIPQSVSEAWSNTPSCPKWFNTKKLPTPPTEGTRLCGLKLCYLLSNLNLIWMKFQMFEVPVINLWLHLFFHSFFCNF